LVEHLVRKAASYRRLTDEYPPGVMRDSLSKTADGYEAQARLVAARLMSEDV